MPPRKSSPFSLQYTFITSHRLTQVFFCLSFTRHIPFTSYHFSFYHFPSLYFSQRLRYRTRTRAIVWYCFHVRIYLSHCAQTNICTHKFNDLIRIYMCTNKNTCMHIYIHATYHAYTNIIYIYTYTLHIHSYVIHNAYTYKPNNSRHVYLLIFVAMRFSLSKLKTPPHTRSNWNITHEFLSLDTSMGLVTSLTMWIHIVSVHRNIFLHLAAINNFLPSSLPAVASTLFPQFLTRYTALPAINRPHAFYALIAQSSAIVHSFVFHYTHVTFWHVRILCS